MEWLTQTSYIHVTAFVLSALVIADTVRRFVRDRIERNGRPLPPGPTPLPLLGSALSINAQEPWLTYTAWRAKYGDVVHVRLLDTNVIVLNSYSDALELLEKRSQIYSDRPFIATLEPYGHHSNFGFARYGPHWRLCRRIMHQTFSAEASINFRPMQLRRARQMIINMIDDPSGYPFHYQTFAAGVSMSAIYDYDPRPRGDPLVTIVEDFVKASFSVLTTEKAILLKVFPFLLSVPEWIPGLSYIRRDASKAYALSVKMTETPYQLVRKRMEAKEEIMADTMVFDHIRRMEKFNGTHRVEYETALKHTSSSAFLGSVESTSSTLMTFTLAMVKNPGVWKRAQAEIDAAIGTDRLPEYEDRPSLPFVEAILRESLRWHPVSALGVPHAVTTDDVYKGYYIPKGASIMANMWAMTRDETRYPDPESFIPERFLDSEEALKEDNPAELLFGFGRRICPGRHTADASLWGAIVTMLATLDFNAVKDLNGNDVEFEAKFSTGLAHHPEIFPCNITPRAHITKQALQRILGR